MTQHTVSSFAVCPTRRQRHVRTRTWGRGNVRPSWELVYNYYVKVKGKTATYTSQFATKVRPEGGGGDYGGNSGGYDQLGFGTLTFSR